MAENAEKREDCYERRMPGEPTFTLLGRDRHAPALVALWATLRELDGESREVVAEARECVLAMMGWGVERGRQYVGFGQTALVGVLELIRQANATARKDANNQPTRDEFVRQLLSITELEKPEGEAGL